MKIDKPTKKSIKSSETNKENNLQNWGKWEAKKIKYKKIMKHSFSLAECFFDPSKKIVFPFSFK